MNLSAVYSKTGKGAKALASKSKALSNNALRILSYIDGKNSAENLFADMGKLSADKFYAAILELLNEGYIKEIGEDYLSRSLSEFEIHNPIEVEEISPEEFLQLEISIDGSDNTVGESERAAAEARAKAYEAEQKRLREEAMRQEEAERKLLNAADILAKSGNQLDIESLAKSHTRLNPRTRNSRRVKPPKAQSAPTENPAQEQATTQAQDADKASLQAGALRKAREEASTRAKLEAELRRKEAEALAQAKARQEKEARAKQDEENKRKAEAEHLAVQARLKAEQEARESAEAQARLEAEKLAKREEEERARAEAKRLAAVAKARQEAEDRALREAEKQARIAEEQRIKAERKAAAEAEQAAKQQLKAEQAARVAAEKLARMEAKAASKREAERLAAIASEKRAKEQTEALRQRLAAKTAKAKARHQYQLTRQAEAAARAQEKANKRATTPERNYTNTLSSFPLTKIRNVFLGAFAIGLLMLMLLPFINLVMFVGTAQRIASASLGEQVLIGGMHVSYWPKPHLVLNDVSIGSAGINATSVQLQPVLSTLTDPTKIFTSIVIYDLTLNETTMLKPAAWLSASQKQGLVRTSLIKAKNITLNTPSINLPAFNSDISLSKDHQFQGAVINSDAGNVHIDIKPSAAGYAVMASASNLTSPIGASIHFDELQVEGALQDQRLQLHKISGQLYGGKLDASMTMAWHENWSAEGKFKINEVLLNQAMPIFTKQISMEGTLATEGIWSANAKELSQLLSSPSITARFSSTDGAIKGIDLVRAIQARGQEKAISGTTNFGQFTGKLDLKNDHYKYKDLELRANELQAQGEVDIFRDQELAGEINVRLAVDSRDLRSRLHLAGKLAQPMHK